MPIFEPVFSALNGAGVRYVVVGGLAVVLHGHLRGTADVDIVLDLEPVSARKAMEALKAIGLKAWAPVDPAAFADPAQRESWIVDKGMTVFSLYSPADPLRILDLFVRSPVPFEELWARSRTIDLGSLKVQAASIDDLIAMKESVARPQDLMDIEALEALKKRALMRAPVPDESDWQCGWEGARKRQLTAGFDAIPARRLAWLEEMLHFAHRVRALPQSEGAPTLLRDAPDSKGKAGSERDPDNG